MLNSAPPFLDSDRGFPGSPVPSSGSSVVTDDQPVFAGPRQRRKSGKGGKVSPKRQSDSIPIPHIAKLTDAWIMDNEIARCSPRTVESRRDITTKFQWFLNANHIDDCDTAAVKLFLHHCTNGHEEPGGRWGNPANGKPVSTGTVATYYAHLRTFFNWAVAQNQIKKSPMQGVPAIINRPDQVDPFVDTDLAFLLKNAGKSFYPERDTAICLLLLDTGIRATELISLTEDEIDVLKRSARVRGKGDKSRLVCFGSTTSRALWAYLQQEGRQPGGPVFESERGGPMSRSGLAQLIHRLGEQVHVGRTARAVRKGVQRTREVVVRAHPHRFRHTFAVKYLLAGGDVFSLQQILGHTDVKMTRRYVEFAGADIARQHYMHSPVEAHVKQRRARS